MADKSAQNPGDLLAQLQSQLAAGQAQNADLAKQLARLNAQIADVTKTVADVTKRGADWAKASATAAQQSKDVNAYIKAQLPLLKENVKNMSEIASAKKDGEKQIAGLQADVDKAKANEQQQLQALEKARAETASKQKAYDDLAGLAAANDAVMKDLAALQANADKEKAANRLSHQYYWILAMEDKAKELRQLSVEDYTKQLNAAASDLAAASGAEREAKDVADAATASRVQAEKSLADTSAKMRDTVAAGITEKNTLAGGDGAPADGAGAPAGAAA